MALTMSCIWRLRSNKEALQRLGAEPDQVYQENIRIFCNSLQNLPGTFEEPIHTRLEGPSITSALTGRVSTIHEDQFPDIGDQRVEAG